MEQKSYVNCPDCNHPIEVPELLQLIKFPEDVEVIVTFLEGKLNVINCPVCTHRVPLLCPVAAINAELKSFLLVIPEHLRGKLEKSLSKLLTDDWIRKYCNDSIPSPKLGE